MRGTHLHYCYVVLVRQSEQRLGYPHVVVEVTLCSHHVIAFRQHGTHQFLRGCLAIRTRNADDRNIELAAMLAGQVLEGLQAVVDENELLGDG